MRDASSMIRRLFAAFDARDVRYCHWKSNQHLDAALAGTTDLDVLVAAAQAGPCRRLLQEFGCRQVVPQPMSRCPGIEDWLAFDAETGALAHIHLHFSIVVGMNPKNYHLPLEEWLLTGCGRLHDLRIAAHARELIVLTVRTALKVRYRDLLKACMRPAYGLLPGAVRAEFDWLLERTNRDDLPACLQASGLPFDAPLLIGFLDRYRAGRITPACLLRFKLKMAGCLKRYALRPVLRVHAGRAAGSVRNFLFRTGRKKTLRERGVFFALVGADGSGKTTLACDLAAWLGWKLETRTLYFGIPKSAWLYAALTKAGQGADMLTARCIRLRFKPAARFLESCVRFLQSLLWVYVAWHRFALSRRAQAYCRKGFVVIGERFPLQHFDSMSEPMDGPRLQKNPRGTLLHRLERFLYTRIGMPDRLIVLKAGADALCARKAYASMALLREKADAVNSIAASDTVFTVDAEESYALVLQAVQTRVWELL